MADLRPFRAYRPRPDRAEKVASPPYDVVNTKEASALAEGNPFSFLHVTRPEIDLPEGTDEHAAVVYEQARTNLEALISDGVLVPDPDPRIYIYAQKMGSHRQMGVVACASVREYDAGLIKKHENTRADKEDDRTKHIDVLAAHDEPVFLTYKAVPAIDKLVADATRAIPLYDFETKDGVQHQLWVLDREQSLAIATAFSPVPALYVADGHHRSAAASRVHKERKGDGGEHDAFLAVVFPDDQMQIMAYNRVVRDLQGRSPEELLELFRARFDVEPAKKPAPDEQPTFGLYHGGKWWWVRTRPGTFDASDPVASLDCSICQDQILGPLFAVQDPRRDKHVDFVGGIRGHEELERRVDSGEMTLALHLYPTQMRELIAVSDAGRLMPPKSTWFEPKLRSGLFVHAF
ncbi:MAG: DUF1015 domain-containing protein [Polyangiaceae bacterium]|nr:DUF1015 domain-containing protein [Polyangiaceae bacterium]